MKLAGASKASRNLWRNRAKSLNDRARMYRAHGHLFPDDLHAIVKRDGSRCVYCGRELDYETAGDGTQLAASFDHMVRLCDGGSNTPENTVCACRGCNGRNAKASIADPTEEALRRLRMFLERKERG